MRTGSLGRPIRTRSSRSGSGPATTGSVTPPITPTPPRNPRGCGTSRCPPAPGSRPAPAPWRSSRTRRYAPHAPPERRCWRSARAPTRPAPASPAGTPPASPRPGAPRRTSSNSCAPAPRPTSVVPRSPPDTDRRARSHGGERADAGLAVAAMLGYDDGTRMLLECLPGASQIPCEPDSQRLRALGAAAARIHTADLEPTNELPVRDRPIADVDFAGMRRDHRASRLLLDAEEIVARTKPADERVALVHGDLWHGNTMWDGNVLSGILDWDRAGARPAGRDLGSLRCDAAARFGIWGAGLALAGWERAAGDP